MAEHIGLLSCLVLAQTLVAKGAAESAYREKKDSPMKVCGGQTNR